jgi:hypothetical protein
MSHKLNLQGVITGRTIHSRPNFKEVPKCPLCELEHEATKRRVLTAMSGGMGYLYPTEEEYFYMLWRWQSNYPFAFGV